MERLAQVHIVVSYRFYPCRSPTALDELVFIPTLFALFTGPSEHGCSFLHIWIMARSFQFAVAPGRVVLLPIPLEYSLSSALFGQIQSEPSQYPPCPCEFIHLIISHVFVSPLQRALLTIFFSNLLALLYARTSSTCQRLGR